MKNLAFFIIISMLPTLAFADTLCHRQTNGNYVILEVVSSYVATHLRHGDKRPYVYYTDNDGDGKGAGSALIPTTNDFCYSPPVSGKSLNNIDLDDTNSSI